MRLPKPITRQSPYGGPIVFGVFTMGGVLFIILAKALHASPFVVTSVPVVLMLAYATGIIAFKNLRLRDDQTGDNFYYMGFIFTLTSLAVSLFQYGTGSDVSEIVSNFGVAVASTIAGIVLRIFFNLLRRDPIEVEHIARLELAEASRKVRRELDNILVEMAYFRRVNQEMLSEGFEEIRSEVKKTTDATLETVENVAKAVERQTAAYAEGGASDKIRSELEATVTSLRSLNGALNEIDDTVRRDGLRRRSPFAGLFKRRPKVEPQTEPR